MFTLKLYDGWERKAAEKTYISGVGYRPLMSKTQMKAIDKLVRQCKVITETEQYSGYTKYTLI